MHCTGPAVDDDAEENGLRDKYGTPAYAQSLSQLTPNPVGLRKRAEEMKRSRLTEPLCELLRRRPTNPQIGP